MKKIIVGVFTISIFFLIGYYISQRIFSHVSESNVLSATNSIENLNLSPILPTSILSPTTIVLPTETPIPQVSQTLSVTQIVICKSTPEEIHGFMERFAAQYSVDVNILRHIAVCESGFNPNAVNGQYAGLYQYNITTWINNRILMGEDPNPDLRFNAEEAIQTTAYLLSLGKFHLWPNCKP